MVHNSNNAKINSGLDVVCYNVVVLLLARVLLLFVYSAAGLCTESVETAAVLIQFL